MLGKKLTLTPRSGLRSLITSKRKEASLDSVQTIKKEGNKEKKKLQFSRPLDIEERRTEREKKKEMFVVELMENRGDHQRQAVQGRRLAKAGSDALRGRSKSQTRVRGWKKGSFTGALPSPSATLLTGMTTVPRRTIILDRQADIRRAGSCPCQEKEASQKAQICPERQRGAESASLHGAAPLPT